MEFKTFSPKQKLAMSWWSRKPYRDYDAIICDGAVRSGKTLSMSIGFISWAMTSFQGGSFALCGKTITALKRNVIPATFAGIKLESTVLRLSSESVIVFAS